MSCPDIKLCEVTRYDDASIAVTSMVGLDTTLYQVLGLCHGMPNYPDCSGTTTLEYSSYMVENINTELGYDIQSLSGEIGGTFGLMLGVCLLDLFTLWQLNKWILRFFKLMLWIAFLYWAAECVKKVVNLSIATDISMNKANMAEDFPLITFCKVPVHHYANETLLGRINLKGTDNLTMDDLTNYIEKYHYDINTYVTNPYIRDDNHLVYLKLSNISTAVHHKLFGLCYTLDVHIEENIPSPKGPITFGMDTSTDVVSMILLHDRNDLYTAYEYSDVLNVEAVSGYHYISKTEISSTSTSAMPCGEYHFEVCKNVELYKILVEKFNCDMSPYFVGEHNESLPTCRTDILITALNDYHELMETVYNICPKVPACQFSKFLTPRPIEMNLAYDMHKFEITMLDNKETQESFIVYDIIALLGESGGFLGICLGYSGLSMVEFLSKLGIKDVVNRRRVDKTCFYVSLIIFAYWSSFVASDYFNENEIMELIVEDGILQPPDITICRIDPVHPICEVLSSYGMTNEEVWCNIPSNIQHS